MRKAVLIGLVLAGIWAIAAERNTHAQTAGSSLPPVVCYQVLHTSCVTAAGTTTYAFASDGLWISMNGGAFAQVQVGTPVAGVTSWNGQTGAVTYTPPTAPVSSVNGKTGAVVLSLQ